jgi:hypothetical protein
VPRSELLLKQLWQYISDLNPDPARQQAYGVPVAMNLDGHGSCRSPHALARRPCTYTGPKRRTPHHPYRARRETCPEVMLQRVRCSRRGVEAEYGGSSMEGVWLSFARSGVLASGRGSVPADSQ